MTCLLYMIHRPSEQLHEGTNFFLLNYTYHSAEGNTEPARAQEARAHVRVES